MQSVVAMHQAMPGAPCSETLLVSLRTDLQQTTPERTCRKTSLHIELSGKSYFSMYAEVYLFCSHQGATQPHMHMGLLRWVNSLMGKQYYTKQRLCLVWKDSTEQVRAAFSLYVDMLVRPTPGISSQNHLLTVADPMAMSVHHLRVSRQ